MSEYYIKPLRAIVDFETQRAIRVESVKDLPTSIPKISLLYADPRVTRTTMDFAAPMAGSLIVPKLNLSAYDLLIILTEYFRMNDDKVTQRRMEGLFWQSPMNAIRIACYCAFPEVMAYGENEYYRNAQWRADPRWQKVLRNSKYEELH